MAHAQHPSGPEIPIFTPTDDLLTWLLPATNHFPRAHRHTATRRLLDAAFDLRRRLEEANIRHGATCLERLLLADEALARVRLYLWLVTRWGWFSEAQYEHVAMMAADIGRFPQRRRLKRRKGLYFQRKLRAMMASHRVGEVPLSRLSASVKGWVNHVRYGNTVGLRKAVLGRLH